MKRYLVFVFVEGAAGGGWEDFHQSFDWLGQAQQAAIVEAERLAEQLELTAHWHIVDSDTEEQRTFGMASKEPAPGDDVQEEVSFEAAFN